VQTAQDAGFGTDEKRFDVQIAHPPDTCCKEADEHLVHRRVLLAQAREVVPAHRVRPARFESRDRGGAALLDVEQRQLAERVSRPVHGYGHGVPHVGLHPGGEAAPDDQVQRVGRIAAVEDHLVAAEAAPLRDRNEAPELRLGQIVEELASKHRELKCDGRDTPCVKRVQHTQEALPPGRLTVMTGTTGTPSGGGREMYRDPLMIKIWLTMAIATGWLLLTQPASAMSKVTDDGGATVTPPTPLVASSDGFNWADATIGAAVALAVTLAVALAAIAVVHAARNRSRLAPSH
jgi:hypothetical protein